MIGLAQPWALLLAPVWLALWLWLAIRQRSALRWIDAHVDDRFRPALTIYGRDRKGLRWHLALVLVLGLLLALAAAGPELRGRGTVDTVAGDVLLLIDASASMLATDLATDDAALAVVAELAGEGPASVDEEEAEELDRLDLGRALARRLVAGLEGRRFALVSFSGVATVHLPLVADRALVDRALEVLEAHTFYRSTGSSFATALDAVFPFADGSDNGLDVVLISDGEQPIPEDYAEVVAALAAQRVPVHAVAIGSDGGQTRLIYDFNDVVAKKPAEERRVLREYTTRREDEDLSRIAEATGGTFARLGAGDGEDPVASLLAALERPSMRRRPIDDPVARTDLTVWPLLLFAIGFLADTLLIGPRRRGPSPWAFDLDAVGIGAALFVLLVLGGCVVDERWRAHRANELGIMADDTGRHRPAQQAYTRSRGYRVEPWIPSHNLARSLVLEERFAEAHLRFQDTLRLQPSLVEAAFNDGVALYGWGVAERDPEDCQLARTLDLWRQAHRRFVGVAEDPAASDALRADAEANLEFLDEEIAIVEVLIEDPPPDCPPPPSPPPPSAGGAGGGGGGGGGSGDDQEEGGTSEDEEDEEEEGGTSEDEEDEEEEGGTSQDREDEQEDGGTSGPQPQPLGADELETVRAALERIAAQAGREGIFYRRTREEQFPREVWANPDPEIWW